jgi:rhodanese-related sulfurtransferase
MRLAGQMVALLALSGVAGWGAHALTAHPLPWRQSWSNQVLAKAADSGVRLVTLAETKALIEQQDILLLDARLNRDYLIGHLPGAFSLPALELDTYLGQVMPLLSATQPLLVYCSGTSCDESLQLAELLRKQGFTNLVLFAGGMAEWEQAGLKVEK